MTLSRVAKIRVGDFEVSDCNASEIVAQSANLVGRKATIFALHVGGLNRSSDDEFVTSMREADLVYADGMSIVWLARLAGAKDISRAATTDIGIPTLAKMQDLLGRTLRIALIGGEPGLAESAAARLVSEIDAELVFVSHGFHEGWSDRLSELRATNPDVLVVGMGMPREAVWVRKYHSDLPDIPILTCGGWFGFLAGHETRAPQWMQDRGLEWLYRTLQDPVRLARRYVVGAVTVARIGWHILYSGRTARR